MKKILYLFLLFLPVLGFAQSRYGVEGVPMCWTTALGVDSSIVRYVLISTTGQPVKTISYENAQGAVVNVSGGVLRYGFCDCAGALDSLVDGSVTWAKLATAVKDSINKSVTWARLADPVKDSIRVGLNQKRDTFITVPHSTNYIPNVVITEASRFYENINLSCRGVTDTSVIAFLGVVSSDHYGVVYNVKNDSGLVEVRVFGENAHSSNSKVGYLLKRGQMAQVRALKDQVYGNGYRWAVGVVWDSLGAGGGNESVIETEGYVGTLFATNAFTDTTQWTHKGAGTVAIGTGKLQFSSGNNDYLRRLKFKQPQMFEKWQIESIVIVTQKDATSYGFALGVESTNTTAAFKYGLAVRFVGETGADQGKIRLVSITGASNTATTITTSTTALTYSANDTIIISVRREQGQLTAEAWNATTNSGRVSLDYNYSFGIASTVIPNTGQFSVFNIGGTFELLKTKINSRELVRPAVMTNGDSKTAGYGANEIPYRWSELIKPTFGSVAIVAGGGDKTAEVLSYIGYTMRKVKPHAVVLSIGSNDLRTGGSFGTYTANYTAIVDTIVANGGVVYHAPFYESGVPITTLYNWIVATYPPSKIIPTYEITSAYLSADNVHPNEAGNQRIANIIISKDSLPVGVYNGIDKTLSGQIPSGGAVAYSSSGNKLKGSIVNGLHFDDAIPRLSIGGVGSVGTLHGVLTNSSANFDFFTLDGPTVPTAVSFGSFGSLWNDGVTAQTLHGLNFGSQILFGIGTASSGAGQLRTVSTGNSMTFSDRGAKKIFYWISNGGFSQAELIGGNAYAGSVNLAGANFPISAGLGSGTGTPGDLIFQTGTSQVSGTTDHVRTNRWWVKGETGRLGNLSAPLADLHIVGECIITSTLWLNAAKTVGIFIGTGSPEGVVTASISSIFHRVDGGVGTSFYVKESGTGNTGWVAK